MKDFMFWRRIGRVKFGEFQRRSKFLRYGIVVRLTETIRRMYRIMFSDVSDILGGLKLISLTFIDQIILPNYNVC